MPRAKAQSTVPDDAILAALPGTARQVGETVGLSPSGAAWRLRTMREAGMDVGRSGAKGPNAAPIWERRRGDVVPRNQSARRPIRQAGGVLCVRCGAATAEHSYREIMRGCAR